MSATRRPKLSDAPDDRIARYQAPSLLAIGGFACGVLSPLWMIDPWLWLLPVPALGILFGCASLWRIARDPALTGRRIAVAGLVLATFFASAGPTHWIVYRRMVRQEAREFAGKWFTLLARREPAEAFQLTLHPTARLPLSDHGLANILPDGAATLDHYCSRPLVKTILALGDGAQVRYYQTLSQRRASPRDFVTQIFAITYRDPQTGEKKTFFASLSMQRQQFDSGRADWQLMGTDDGFTPEGL